MSKFYFRHNDSLSIFDIIVFDIMTWIRNIILKNTPALAKSLRLVFQTSLNKGKFPTSWKISEITPIYKENDGADISQYRPISLLKNVSKVFEIYESSSPISTDIKPITKRLWVS